MDMNVRACVKDKEGVIDVTVVRVHTFHLHIASCCCFVEVLQVGVYLFTLMENWTGLLD